MARPRPTGPSRARRKPAREPGSLAEYRRKRRFEVTPEPAPKSAPGPAAHRFVIQKHDATRLHYDFRLEVDGVLKSWAVPKGPSLNPADKRLAMQTEDHPLEYADFEGVIPEGEYGAGPVIVWDRGAFTPEGPASAAEQIERGELKFSLQGEKLRGGFVLVKIRGRDTKGRPWLLIKHRDAAADPEWKIEEHDGSVISGRTLKQVEEGAPQAGAPAARAAAPVAEIEGARKANMPASLRPMLATLVEKPFSDPDWMFEIKWDGVRSLAWVRDGKLTLRSRNGLDITRQYPEFAELPRRISARTAILDGEIVALEEKGVSKFERLQPRMHVR
ncbi:MAG: DNA polymerase ligase N-terminal domain-containing protein, partial [Terriglobia bacterium]